MDASAMGTRQTAVRQRKGLGRYKKGKRLGQGAFGTVYQGIDQLTGQFVAIKVINADVLNQDEEVGNEFALLQKLSHKNIVRYIDYEYSEDATVLRIYLEYVDGGSLASVVKQYGRLSEVVCSTYTDQVLRGLQYLHSHNVLHRDIKPANLLVSIDASVKLADFGASKKIQDGAEGLQETKFVGTPAYVAPEAIRGRHTFAADVWSLGCTLLELATGKQPWHGAITYTDVKDFIGQVGTGEVRPLIPEYLSETLAEFLGRALRIDPVERATCEELLTHPFTTFHEDVDEDEEGEEWEEYEEWFDEELEESDDGDDAPGAHAAGGGGGGGGVKSTIDALFVTEDLSDSDSDSDCDGASDGPDTAAVTATTSGGAALLVTAQHQLGGENASQGPTPTKAPPGAAPAAAEEDPDPLSGTSKTVKTDHSSKSKSSPRIKPMSPVGASPGGAASGVVKLKRVVRNAIISKRAVNAFALKGACPSPTSGWNFHNFHKLGAVSKGAAGKSAPLVEADLSDDEADDDKCDMTGLFIAAHHCNDVLAKGFFANFERRPSQTTAELPEPAVEATHVDPTGATALTDYLSISGTPDGLVTIDLRDHKPAPPPPTTTDELPDYVTYKFDVFFHENTTPTELYERIGQPIIRCLMKSSTPGKKVSITCAGMPYSGKSQTVIGKDNVYEKSQMGFLPLIIKSLYDSYGAQYDFYISSMCCRKEKAGVFDNVNHTLIDGVSDWEVLRGQVLQKAGTWQEALADLDLSKLGFLGVKSPHMLVIEVRPKGADAVTSTLFVTLLYGRQWTYWLNGLTFLVHRHFIYGNTLAASSSGHCLLSNPATPHSGGDAESGLGSRQTTGAQNERESLQLELQRYISNEFFGILEQIYHDGTSMNYILHNFHGLAGHLNDIVSSLSALGSATREAPPTALATGHEIET
eukprot:TRINITY_DN3727_c0_g1_i1.p1 TRINITY_DN3727_c0_g1~~TRINITY_DN3727_c0_g1_i1.p1  ORF type:complete len:923 (+),score=304.11 TRINITY_DN3727_c0_g1_i1:179-2947(+)